MVEEQELTVRGFLPGTSKALSSTETAFCGWLKNGSEEEAIRVAEERRAKMVVVSFIFVRGSGVSTVKMAL